MASTCKYCGREIHWQNITGLWVPFEDESCIIRHACRKRVEIVTPPPLPRPGKVEPFTAEEVQVLKRFVECLKVVA